LFRCAIYLDPIAETTQPVFDSDQSHRGTADRTNIAKPNPVLCRELFSASIYVKAKAQKIAYLLSAPTKLSKLLARH